MEKTPTKIHRMVVFIGLAAAIVLCAFSCIALGRVRPPRARPSRAGSSIEELDALAKPHFDEAERNVPSVVADLTSQSNFLKLCCLMVEDKLSGSEKTQKFIESKIHARIVVPCQRGADVYGCIDLLPLYIRAPRKNRGEFAARSFRPSPYFGLEP